MELKATTETYWNGNGKHQTFADFLNKYVPTSGYTNHDYMNAFLFMSRCYHDLYNNGLCNWSLIKRDMHYLNHFSKQLRPSLEGNNDPLYTFQYPVRLLKKNEQMVHDAFEEVMDALLSYGKTIEGLHDELAYYFIDSKTFLDTFGFDTNELKKRAISWTKIPLPFEPDKPIAQYYVHFRDTRTVIDEHLVISGEKPSLVIDIEHARPFHANWDDVREKAVMIRDMKRAVEKMTDYDLT